MLVAAAAVEAAQADFIPREVCGYPVEDHADSRLMQPVDQPHEPFGVAEAGGCGVIACDLIAPRAVEGMLHHGQKLHMRVAHVRYIGDQLVGDLLIGQHGLVLVQLP